MITYGWMGVLVVLTIVLICVYLTACDEQLTKSQWDARYAPQTIEQAKAKVVLETGLKTADQKMKSAAQIDSIKFWCFLGLGGALVAMFLGTTAIKQTGFGLVIICGAMIAIVQFYTTFPLLFAYAGGAIALGAACYAVWQHRKALATGLKDLEIHKTALTEVVQGNETFKTLVESPIPSQLSPVENFKNSQVVSQSPATTAIVSKIRNGKNI